MTNVYTHKFNYELKKSDPDDVIARMQGYLDMRNCVLGHIWNISQKLDMPMYFNKNNGNIITNNQSYTHGFNEMTTLEHLQEIYSKQEYADIYLPHPFSANVIVACLQESPEVKEWFFKNSETFFSVISGKEWNDVIEYVATLDNNDNNNNSNSNHNTPRQNHKELLIELIAHTGPKFGKVSEGNLEKTITLLSEYLPYPENVQSLALYFFKHKDDLVVKGISQSAQQKLIEGLENHFPNELEQFYFLDFVKKHHQSQTIVFGTNEIERTLRVQIDYQNIAQYMGLKSMTDKNIKDWMRAKILTSLDKAFEENAQYFAVHSIEHAVQNDSKVHLYINLKEGSPLTHDKVSESFLSLFNDMRAQAPKTLIELYELSQNYMASYWLKEKISAQIENHNDNNDEITTPASSSPKNKI